MTHNRLNLDPASTASKALEGLAARGDDLTTKPQGPESIFVPTPGTEPGDDPDAAVLGE